MSGRDIFVSVGIKRQGGLDQQQATPKELLKKETDDDFDELDLFYGDI